ncbi:MAG: uridine kinase [Bacteroidales bacterium]|nr:uridine kinase [Bacteroidales bacterium]
MYIIGIAGGTGSGKTTVVKKIIESIPDGRVALIPQDSYYNDTTELSIEERRKINFDHPDAFDWKLLTKQIEDLRSGKAIEQPTYSYLISNRLEETVHVEPCEVIIIEGIMALWSKELRELMDLKIFVDADPDERLIRVIQRDTIERGRTPQMVIDRYLDVLKPMHEEFIEPTKRFADLIIPQGGNNRQAIDIMRTYIIHRTRPELRVESVE